MGGTLVDDLLGRCQRAVKSRASEVIERAMTANHARLSRFSPRLSSRPRCGSCRIRPISPRSTRWRCSAVPISAGAASPSSRRSAALLLSELVLGFYHGMATVYSP